MPPKYSQLDNELYDIVVDEIKTMEPDELLAFRTRFVDV